jgi:hypothetical protein
MNISFIKLKSVIAELRGIRRELGRLADCWEAEMAEQGYHMTPPKADTSGPEPSMSYVDEEEDWLRETVDRYRRIEDEAVKKEE